MDPKTIQKKLTVGFFSLTLRKALLDIINFVTIYVILASILPFSLLGVFVIASGILAFFSYFSDFGLAGAIIQKKEITEHDLKTTFLIQEIVAFLISVSIWFAAPILADYYKFEEGGMWLIRALAVGFFLTSLKVIPSVLLERDLRFERIVWADVLEAIVFNGLLIYLSFSGYGIWSFVWAVLAQRFAGLTAIYILAPWRVKIGFSKQSAKELFHFGVPFQLNSILALLKDRLTPLVTAFILGSEKTGYISWAQGIANRPLEVMSIVIRVTFPAFSRLQHDKDALKAIVEKALFLTVVLLYPVLFGIMAVLPVFIEVMGKQKFQPTMHLIYIFTIASFWAIPSTTFTNVLNAVGKIKITLFLMVMWTALTWILAPVFAYYFDYTGVAVAYLLISFTSIIPIIYVSRMLAIDILLTILIPFVCSLIMALSVYIISLFLPKNLLSLIGLVITGGVIYLVLIYVLAKDRVVKTLLTFKNA
jgi:O-antigen/teichoic acid export membrane protein